MSGPAYIATIEPLTGEVTGVAAAPLPEVARRRSSESNPSGTIVPGLGAIDDYLVIVDPEMNLLVIYQ